MASVPSGYSCTRTVARTRWGRSGVGGICRPRPCQRTQLSLPRAWLPAPTSVVGAERRALLLDAEDVAPERLGHLDEDRRRLLSGLDKTGIVLGQVNLAKEAVGGLDGGDPGQGQLLGQAILQASSMVMIRSSAG
jgi:hypothetical protein